MFKNFVLVAALLLLLPAANIIGAENGAEVNLNMTVVSASLSPQPELLTGTNVSVITAEHIAAAHTRDISLLLNQAAGLDLPKQASPGNAEILSIRGVPSQQVLILLDGFPLNSPSLGLTDLSQIPLENIEKIEIVRGADSAWFGANAVGGVVNIITKKPQSPVPLTDITLSGGSFNSQAYKFSFGAKPGDLDYLVSSSRSFSDGWRKNNDYENNAFSLHLGYDLGVFGHLKINDQYYRGNLGVPGASSVPIDQWNGSAEREASSPNAKQEDLSNFMYAEYQRNFTENIIAKVKPYYKETRQIFRDHNIFFDIDNSTNTYTINTDNSINTYTGGVTAQFDLLKDWSAGGEYRQDKVNSRDNNLGYDALNKSISSKSLYGQYGKNIAQWYATFGARYDDYSLFGGQFTPRTSLVYIFNPQWKASVNISRGYRPPTLNDLYWPEDAFTKGNKDLKPEKADSFDLGLEINLFDMLQSKATVFYILSKDLIQWASDATTKWTPQNIAKAKNMGAEIEINHNLYKKLIQRLTYTALNVEGSQENTSDYLLLAFRPKHRLNYTLSYAPLNTFKIDLSNQWIAKSFEQDGERGAKIPSSTIWNADLNKKINNATFFFRVENIFNRRYANRTSGSGNFYPLPGRTYWLSFDLYLIN